LQEALAEDPDAVLTLLPELVAATDERLRERARRLAGRVILDRARRGTPTRRGIGRPQLVAGDVPGADLDLDASLETVAAARANGGRPALGDLRARDWGRATVAVCLLVDRSGSMAGERLATAALAAAACTWRAPADNAVLVFAAEVIALRDLGEQSSTTVLIDQLLDLRGRGTTDLAAGLAAAAAALERSQAARRVCILLSDCDANVGGDPISAARRIDELIVVGPAAEAETTRDFCRRSGAHGEVADGPTATVAALARLLS
jgi:Mg-chelatase subunit ChlD